MQGRSSTKEDRLSYIRLLRLAGVRGKSLKKALARMETKEILARQLLPEKPLSYCLRENVFPDIDLAWIEGFTCSSVFDVLTCHERYFLYLVYHYPIEEVIEILCISRATYYRYVIRVREQIKNASGLW